MDDIAGLEKFTIMPYKISHYVREEEGYLGRGASAALEAFGSSLARILDRFALMVVKPDTVVRRQVELCVSILQRNNFAPVAMVPVVLTDTAVRALYRFQFNAITEGGKALSDRVYTRDASLLPVLRYAGPLSGRSASRRLARLKGSEPDRPTPNSLRSAIGAISKVFDGVHCADESLDVLREMAVLFQGARLSELFAQLAEVANGGNAPDVRVAIEEVYALAPQYDLNLQRATTRLRTALDQAAQAPLTTEVARRLRAAIKRATAAGGGLDWFSFSADLQVIGIDPSGWDALLFASQYVEYEIPGATKLIGNFSEFDRG